MESRLGSESVGSLDETNRRERQQLAFMVCLMDGNPFSYVGEITDDDRDVNLRPVNLGRPR